MGKLNLNFSHSFNGKVWNIISHPDRELLLIEVRNKEAMEVYYSLLNVSTREFLLEGLQFDEHWWIGVSWFIDDVIVFHTWPEEDNPDFRYYFGFDISGRQILWKMADKNILDIKGYSMEVITKGEQEIEFYNVLSGSKISPADAMNDFGKKQNKSVEKPFHYREGSDYFDTVSDFIRTMTGKEAVRGTDYYENDEVMIMSVYFLNQNDKLDNHLFVVDHQGDPLMDIQLENDSEGISAETFFIYHNKLIFVAHTRDFFIYQLP
ncbi:hypothetical protein C900_02211 [Fulvivirga imtechensis AK7]|uniref:DUF4905 domain-containing protein n=1 Tax=Fulvivirga imtechensis AK7 TaxID=1237149 RepID=L8JSA0_9BACT|nr:DUF4905 domain-containing protein [Fulvivirga imtechensis]ELR71836.1 hypothetical protein C900_02211 [Fulvivirga imtechensis AK7]